MNPEKLTPKELKRLREELDRCGCHDIPRANIHISPGSALRIKELVKAESDPTGHPRSCPCAACGRARQADI